LTTIEHSSYQPENSGFFFREKRKPGTVDASDTDTVDKIGTDSEKALLCAQCRAVVTSHQHAVTVNGNHLHAFFNPAGIIYEIRCFKQAKGCTVHGHPTDEFSWFTGYTWRYALCAGCLAHLGWMFESGGNAFFGLIQSKLIDT
jgi:hypothetical protein